MGYQYYASAIFPSSARKIQTIAEFLDGSEFIGELQESDGLICVSNSMANCGQLEITGLLDEHRVPYDHYHRDDIACEVWTEKHRVNDEGALTEVCSISEQDEGLSGFAKNVLEALESGETEKAYALLNTAIINDAKSIEEFAAEFAVLEVELCQ